MKYEMKCYPGDEPRIPVTREFVERNGLSINADRAIEITRSDGDFLGFKAEVAYDFIPFKECKEFLKKEYIEKVESGEEQHGHIADVMEAAQDFLDYMVFAWMKAMDERGISASRSVQKLAAWMRILGREDVAGVLEDDGLYAPYGRPALKEACKMLGIVYPDYL